MIKLLRMQELIEFMEKAALKKGEKKNDEKKTQARVLHFFILHPRR
jgi:hypothetical protein